MADQRDPVRSFWGASLLVLAACFVLWLAIQLIIQIWGWLLLGGLVALAIFVLISVIRWRRNRW